MSSNLKSALITKRSNHVIPFLTAVSGVTFSSVLQKSGFFFPLSVVPFVVECKERPSILQRVAPLSIRESPGLLSNNYQRKAI